RSSRSWRRISIWMMAGKGAPEPTGPEPVGHSVGRSHVTVELRRRGSCLFSILQPQGDPSMLKSFSRWFVMCSLLGMWLLVANSQLAHAQVKPFKISGSGVAPQALPLPGQDPRPHGIDDGNATHLGRYTGFGSVKTDSAIPDFDAGIITGEFGSGDPFTFVGANGDKLVCHYGRTDKGAAEPGTFELTILGFTEDGFLIVEAAFIAEFVPQPESTGKFAGVTGGWIMYAFTEPFVLGST